VSGYLRIPVGKRPNDDVCHETPPIYPGMSPDLARRFEPALLADLDEPVQRYFTHAIRDGAPLGAGVRLTMSGRIKAGTWLPFTAEQEIDGRSFVWRARVGLGPVALLGVVDQFSSGQGSIEGRLFGRVKLFHAEDADTTRAAAGRVALDSVLVPPSVLPDRGVSWRAESDEELVASFDLPPERPEVHVRINEEGAVRSLVASRWGNAGQKAYEYIPCGGEVHAERRFGEFVLPSSVTASWWYGTPREAPFFEAEMLDLALIG
jgi:hypothetical protein